ncbi:CBS domain-containing protein [Streptomyces nigrescens]
MPVARDIMTPSAECIGSEDSVLDAARKLADMGVGALPICGTDDKLKGVVTDRDITVKVLGKGRDPQQTKAGELAQGEAVTIGADDGADEIFVDDGTTFAVRLGHPPSPLPEPVADLIGAYIQSCQHLPYASSRSSQWQPIRPRRSLSMKLRAPFT